MPTLDQLRPGRRGRVLSLQGQAAVVQRLLDLGLLEGAEVEVRLRRSEADRRRKIKEAFERIMAHPIPGPIGIDEIIEEMKRERDEHVPGGEPPAS